MGKTQQKDHSISRRGFLKTGLAAGALGLAGAGSMAVASDWLAPSVAEAAADETVAYTYHNEHCLCNCMLECTVRDGRLRMIQPRPNDDRRFQNICLKGISEIQHIYGEARIQQPMKRVGERGSGEFEVVSWDEAFGMIAEAVSKAQDVYGKESVWVQFSTEAQQRFTPLLPSLLQCQTGGMNGYDMGQGNGQGQAFGWSGMFAENTIWEWPHAKTVLLVNCNLIETSMMWSRAFLDAQEAGTKIISFDPRFSPTASKADQWVGLRAGTDPAFFLAMTKHILDHGLYDEAHIMQYTTLPCLVDKETGAVLGDLYEVVDEQTKETKQQKNPYVWDADAGKAVPHDTPGVAAALSGEFQHEGRTYITEFDLLVRDMERYTLEWGEEVTGVTADVIAQVAREYAEGPSIIANGVGGIDKFGNNDVAGHCYALIAALTGNYGKRGTGCGIYTYHVSRFEAKLGSWALPEGYEPAHSTMGFYDMVQKDDSVRVALFFGDIPTQKAAHWGKTLEWLDSLDFSMLADVYHSSVADYVDLVVPACSKFESIDEIGGVKNANGYVVANQRVIDPLFQAKPDFYIERGIAEALGLGDLMPEDSIEYARAVLESEDPMVQGFTLETLNESKGAQKYLGTEDDLGPEIGFTCHTPSTKQEPYYENLVEWGQAFPAWEQPNEAYPENPLREKYPLQFNQARSRFRVHSTYSGAQWIKQFYEPHIELNPLDAQARGLRDGDRVRVFNDRGEFSTKLRINNSVQPDSAFMVESSYRDCLNGTMMQSVTNDQLNPRGYDLPFGPMIPFNDTLIEIEKAGE